jgi:hypothetical protein
VPRGLYKGQASAGGAARCGLGEKKENQRRAAAVDGIAAAGKLSSRLAPSSPPLFSPRYQKCVRAGLVHPSWVGVRLRFGLWAFRL